MSSSVTWLSYLSSADGIFLHPGILKVEKFLSSLPPFFLLL